jgi:hypothetical protein
LLKFHHQFSRDGEFVWEKLNLMLIVLILILWHLHLLTYSISLFSLTLDVRVLSLGSAPSCSSTPPPAFDDINESAYNNQSTKHLSNDYRSSSDRRLNSPRSTTSYTDSVRWVCVSRLFD